MGGRANPTPERFMTGPEEILDCKGQQITVGSKVDGGDAIGEVTAIRSVSDNEGGRPVVLVAWPGQEGTPEEWDTRIRNYRKEGPHGPYVYVCDEAEVVDG